VSDAHLANIIKVDLSAQVFTYDIDERALNRARMMDGKLILVSNMPDHSPAEIVSRYKALADIERGSGYQSEIEIAPVFHWLPERIPGARLDLFPGAGAVSGAAHAVEGEQQYVFAGAHLEVVRRIQFHQVTLHQRQAACGLSTMTPEQKELFHAVNLPEPDSKAL